MHTACLKVAAQHPKTRILNCSLNAPHPLVRTYYCLLYTSYTQLRQKGEAYNNAYAQDYGQYQDYLNQLGTLHDYYSAQEQQQAARRQQAFNNVVTVLGVLGDAVQILSLIHI